MVSPRVRAISSARTFRSRGGRTSKNDLGAVTTHAVNLDARRRLGHHNDGWRPERFGDKCDGRAVIAQTNR